MEIFKIGFNEIKLWGQGVDDVRGGIRWNGRRRWKMWASLGVGGRRRLASTCISFSYRCTRHANECTSKFMAPFFLWFECRETPICWQSDKLTNCYLWRRIRIPNVQIFIGIIVYWEQYRRTEYTGKKKKEKSFCCIIFLHFIE